ncbi:MAG: shikimate dehydrogenase [Brevinematales bacterium]|nr:shikimate dehydrogenase [Brevinematales bacterium]
MKINAETSLYCIFGNPVKHSFSPYIHNAAFRKLQINSVYLAFEVENIGEAMKSVKTLNIKGCSITIPFKSEVMNYLDEVSDIAKLIGAVNTVINENNRLYGTNTDAYGFYKSLSNEIDITDKNIAVFGSGGSARAGIFSLFYYGKPAKVFIIARNKEKREIIKEEIISSFKKIGKNIENRLVTLELKEWKDIEADVIVNTTPLGMFPDIDNSIIDKSEIPEGKVVMDIVYNPVKTKFLGYAEERNCSIINGLEMLLQQGMKQFEIWTGTNAPEDVMREELNKIFIDKS